jgi:hypothetical protein
MDKQYQHIETLNEIRSIMEKSTRFFSLSGLSGVFLGVYAILGAIPFIVLFGWCINFHEFYNYAINQNGSVNYTFYLFFFGDIFLMLFLAILTAVLMTTRRAKKKNQAYFDTSAKRLLINLFIPLATGGIFCLLLMYHNEFRFLAPVTLLFYGLALFNAGKYTLNDIRYLGLIEMALGLISSFFVSYSFLFWIIGFGLMHIIYGIVMYIKYEK